MDKVDFYNGFVALSWRDVVTIRYYHFTRSNLRRIMFPACEKLMNAHIRIYDLQNKQLKSNISRKTWKKWIYYT